MEIIKIEKQVIIDTNQKTVEGWKKTYPDSPDEFGVRRYELESVLEIVDGVGHEQNLLDNLIIKAAYIMGSISWAQPFTAANKRTGILSAATFLSDNGYNLEIREQDEPFLRKALYDIQLSRSELDDLILGNLISYITNGISKTVTD